MNKPGLKNFLMMKYALVFFFASATSFAQKASNTLVEELDMLNNIELLPKYVERGEAHMLSSYDSTGGNDDGFSGKYSFIRKEGEDRLVIADLKGPGVIQRIWTPIPTRDTIQFYFDGEKEPRINIKFEDLFTGKKYPFVAPLCGNEIGGYFSYIPIPFAKSLKIVYVGSGLKFHQIQYRLYKKNKKVTSFHVDLTEHEKKALERASQPWIKVEKDQLGQNGRKKENLKTYKKQVSINPGETLKWVELSGGGRIVSITMDNASQLESKNTDLIFRAKWDDDPNYGINVPLAPLFGYAFGEKSMHSLLMGTDGETNYTQLPMPFDDKAVLELHYLKRDGTAQPTFDFEFTLAYSDEKRNPKKEGRLYATWNREFPKEGKPFTILKQQGKGHHVGTLLFCQSTEEKDVWFPTGFFEGDDVTTIDGELRMHGTGSEDYFNGGWYGVADRWDAAHSLPIHGCLDYSIPLARTAAYRFYTSDKVNFEQSYELTIEHDGGENKWAVDYGAIALYYGDRPPTQTMEPTPMNTLEFTPPKRLEIVLNHFNIQSLAFPPEEVAVNYTKVKDKHVFKFSTKGKRLVVKNNLEVPVEGEYSLYISYFKSPESGSIRFFQRQKPVSEWIDINAQEAQFTENHKIGNIHFKEGKAPLTFWTKGEPGENGFILHKMFLVKNNQ
ncbi:DUF2961 domain-containing protein [Fulvivirgaceae bacterium BMA10]|uniref:DUF2961 domain-containing protein n=1 Tax=Splendidivirga corallicola TaxID=3051826 RepID=A0ABT8KWD3_9BACT|nr:DUF2961 domain-containing protein [Fulvivirgaceae bacterium BMA10]